MSEEIRIADEAQEFDCVDCGASVVRLTPPGNGQMRCAGCQWLTELPPMDAEEKMKLRRHMARYGIIVSGRLS